MSISWPRPASPSVRLPLYRSLDVEDAPRHHRRLPKHNRSLIILVGLGSTVLVITFFCVDALWSNRPPPLLASPAAPLPDVRRNLSASLPAFLASGSNLPSAKWAPAPISTCLPGMSPYLAPCLAERREGAVYGEELIYPDFRLREPLFAPSRIEEDRPEWRRLLRGIRDRATWCADEEWVCYNSHRGQNIVLANATYDGNPPADLWVDNACMSDRVSTAVLETAPPDATINNIDSTSAYDEAFPVDTLLVATSPDSWSFQHFLDRITHIVAQAAHLSHGHAAPDVVTGRPPGPAVEEMWEMLGVERDKIHYRSPRVAAKALVFSCRAPLIHPWLSLRTLETFGLDPAGVPLEQRKKVVYVSRSHGGASNGGRRVLNEDELLYDIGVLLEERGEGEELVLFHVLDTSSQRALMSWFHENVRAVIGPHGGGLYNHRWAGRDTLVLEMMPRTYTSHMFWEEAGVLGQTYANVLLEPAKSERTNMDADIPAVLDLLREHLGKPDPRGPALERVYDWHAAELDVNGPR